MLKMRSMSWIIRSSTTFTSVPRCLKRREPSRLDETRYGQRGLQGLNRGVESLEMPDLQNALGAARMVDETLAFQHRHRHGLFNQHMRARIQKSRCGLIVHEEWGSRCSRRRPWPNNSR